MLQATPALARRVDRAEIDFCALAESAGGTRAESLLVAGGRAIYGAAGSPLNKVLGLGLGAPVTDADLDAIEAFYARHASPVAIELCPLTVADLPTRLSKRGYVVQGFENQLARAVPASPLDPWDPADACHADARRELTERRRAPRVSAATPAENDLWLDVVARGFALGESAPETAEVDPQVMATMREMMKGFLHPAITRYLAWVDREPAGGGASWVHDGVVGIFGTSTVAAFRRRGVQTVLSARSVDDAIGQADLAITTTAPGSLSQRTFERLGFQVLYTRTIFVKSLVTS